jgi:biotin-(acetyl-CoA carboxylase) ligase
VATIAPDGAPRDGVARGIDADGALRVERADGTVERILAGEVSVRARD